MNTLIFRATALALVCVAPLPGQESSQPRLGDRFIGAWAGVSPNVRGHNFDVPSRQVFLLGLRAEWVVETLGPLALATTADLLPVAVVTRTPTYRVIHITTPLGNDVTIKEQTGSKAVYGAGAVPFGFKLFLRSSHSIRFFANSAVGGLWFTRDMPVPDARKFNISFEYGGGVELTNQGGGALVLGYKFHHLSNANSAAANPGLEGNMFYFGLSHRR